MYPRAFLVSLLALVLCACTFRPPPYDENSPRTLVPVGSTLTLTQAITVPAGRRSVYILSGKVVPFGVVDIYYPYCQFRLKKIGTRARVVRPDTFVVRKTKQWDEYSRRSDAVRLADRRSSFSIGVGMDDGGPSIISQATILTLQSKIQPDVDDVVCQHWGDQGQTPQLTIRQIRDTLAPLFRLQTARPPGS